MDKRRGTKTNL